MASAESRSEETLIEQDLERLMHASQANGTFEAPNISETELLEVNELTNSLANLRDAERELTEASRSAMNLSAQEMSALQFLVVSSRRGNVSTPTMLAKHLRISPASTTKLLNRLERGGHISRRIHPSDRRAFTIEVRPQTEALIQRSVGRQQARRFLAASRLSSGERAIVTRFVDELIQGITVDRQTWASMENVLQALDSSLSIPDGGLRQKSRTVRRAP